VPEAICDMFVANVARNLLVNRDVRLSTSAEPASRMRPGRRCFASGEGEQREGDEHRSDPTLNGRVSPIWVRRVNGQ